MLRLQGSTVIAPIDVGLLQDTVACAIERWRDVEFVDGRIVDPTTGGTRAGLQVADGHHPREGVRYRAFACDESAVARVDDTGALSTPAPAWRVATVDLVADRPARIEIAVHQDHAPAVDVRGEIGPRDRPARLDATVDTALPGAWPLAGRLRVEVDGAVDESSSSTDRIADLAVRIRHPRARGRATVEVVRLDPDLWEVRVSAQLRGRGVLRPIAAVALRFARRSIERSFREGLDKVAGQVAEIDTQLRAPDGSLRTADDLAAELITESIRAIPEVVPDEVQQRR